MSSAVSILRPSTNCTVMYFTATSARRSRALVFLCASIERAIANSGASVWICLARVVNDENRRPVRCLG